ncbi:plasmid partition protein ParG [Ramlibacter sp. PS3R-8]|uniref:plasmid partition protein ParG n=2 Tax=Ramlibacter sp. PS3R-8 TaxID=3133437 RepID=UPI0030A823FA
MAEAPSMEDKPARLTVLMDAEKKKAFEALCASQDITASQVVRQLIREYLARHGIDRFAKERRRANGS